jgi:tRNA(fMet)-specific endonuclease VapC
MAASDADSKRYMLDTNMVSFIVRDQFAPLVRRLRELPLSSLCISAISQAELLCSVARKPGASALKAKVDGVLLRIEALPWDGVAAQAYGTLRATLERRGQGLANLDTLIAAHSLSLGLVLVSNDQAFTRVPGLVVEDWTAD